MNQKTKGTSLALLVMCALFSVKTFASIINQDNVGHINSHIKNMNDSERKAAMNALKELAPEQKTKLKNTLKEKYESLSDADKLRLKGQVNDFIMEHPQALRIAVERLSASDQQFIVQQIMKRVDTKIRNMSSEQRKVLYTKLKEATTPHQRLQILSIALGRIGEVTYGIHRSDILDALNDMSLSELERLFHDLGTAVNDKFGDTMLGSDLANIFTGLGDLAGFMDAWKGDESPGVYAPLFLRTPNAAKCRSEELLTPGVAVDCVVTERNVFFTPAPYAAGRIVEKQAAHIAIECADGWTANGEYCMHPDIPGAGVKAMVTFDGDTIISGGEPYKLKFKDHFTTENQSAPKPVGNGAHYIDDDSDGFNSCPNISCRMGNGIYQQAGSFGDSLRISVIWKLFDSAKKAQFNEKAELGDLALNNLHPFKVTYSDIDEGLVIREDLVDKGSPSSFIVTNMPGWAASCEIDQPEQTVDLGTVWAKDIKSGPIESSLKAFEIGMKCSGTQTDYEPFIRLTTSASTGSEVTGGEPISYLNNQYTGANAADNIGIILYYDLSSGRQPVPFFNTSANYPQKFDLSADANPRLKFLAAFYKSAYIGEIKAGKFEADVTVEMIYP